MRCGVMLFIMMLLILTGFSCGKNSEAVEETRQYYSEMIDLVKKCSDTIDKSRDADSASRALNSFIESRKHLLNRGKTLSSKYPDLRTDPALVEYEKSLETAMSDFSISLTNAIGKYKNAKVFRKAVESLKNRHDEKSNN